MPPLGVVEALNAVEHVMPPEKRKAPIEAVSENPDVFFNTAFLFPD